MRRLPKSITYRESGVDIAEADKFVDFLKTSNRNIGGFSGLMPVPKGYKSPLLVASTDGVGTKLLVAKEAGDLSTIGIDLVAMVVNDLLVCGARPLFFLDYYATGKLRLKEARQVVEGILEGCRQAGWPLIGGETAELPGLYHNGDFDLAGFGVGVVEAKEVIDGRTVKPGDRIFGFSSSGIHSNGYSLARKALLDRGKLSLKKKVAGLEGRTLAKALLEPTRIYSQLTAQIRKQKAAVKAYAHITGGGIPGNLNRVLPKGADAEIQVGSWPVTPIFDLIAQTGPVSEDEMFRTFNMGLGFIAIAPESERKKLEKAAKAAGEQVYLVGQVVKGIGKVHLI